MFILKNEINFNDYFKKDPVPLWLQRQQNKRLRDLK